MTCIAKHVLNWLFYCAWVGRLGQLESSSVSVQGGFLSPPPLGTARQGLSRGLSALILWLRIRTYAAEIYPYVTEKVRACGGNPDGWDGSNRKHSSVLAVQPKVGKWAALLGTRLLPWFDLLGLWAVRLWPISRGFWVQLSDVRPGTPLLFMLSSINLSIRPSVHPSYRLDKKGGRSFIKKRFQSLFYGP